MKATDDYWRFAESEQHFNTTQAGIRQHAATWMLAAFAAIALLLKTDQSVTWIVPPAVLVGVVSLMATLGLLVLWINDQLVYQRLLDCGFIIALKMEYDDPKLPPLRSMMMYAAEGRGMARWMTHFYTIPMWGFLAITVAATMLRKGIGTTGQAMTAERSLVVLLFACVAQLCATLWVQWKKSDVGARNRAALYEVPEFTSMFDGTPEARTLLAKVIERHKPARFQEEAADSRGNG